MTLISNYLPGNKKMLIRCSLVSAPIKDLMRLYYLQGNLPTSLTADCYRVSDP
jgi:hypothetical protein